MRIHIAAAFAATALAAALPSAASASIAGTGGFDGDAITYAAAPGEQNRVRVSAEGNAITFQDPAADIEAGRGCVSSGPHRVTCTTTTPNVFISVLVEDGNDEVSTQGTPPENAVYIAFDGDSGDDRLAAGDWPAALNGGTGADDLLGGPGSPQLGGVDVYARNNLPRLPLQAPARDTIECVAPPANAPTDRGPVVTNASFDELDQVSGPCGQTSLYRADFIEVRGTPGNDPNLYGGQGPSRVYGLEGDDNIGSGSGVRAYGGPGNDRIYGSGLLLGGDGDDRLDSIATDVRRSSMGGGNGNDFITGSKGRNKIDGGAGTDRISGRGGRDQIKAFDGERDRVTCGDGRDTVTADRIDNVARDCESVTRRTASGSRAAAAAAAATSPRATASATRCARSKARGSRIIARTKTAVAWTRGTFANYACLYKEGKVRSLPNEGGGIKSRGGRVKLAGRFVAYATYGSAIGDEFDRVYVYDIRAGRQVLVESSNFVAAIVLKPNASVAWVQGSVVEDQDANSDRFEVRKVSFAEKQGNVLLDRSASVVPSSLKLSDDGNSVTWTRDGATQVAPLG